MSRLRIGVTLAFLALSGGACAPATLDSRGGDAAPVGAGEVGETGRAETDSGAPPTAWVEAAGTARADGDWGTAAALADMAADSLWGRSGLADPEAADLASLLADLGEEVRAAEFLLVRPEGAGGDGGLEKLRRAARGMSVAELEVLAGGPAARSRDREAAGVVAVERARALALAGRTQEALRAARVLRDGELAEVERVELRRILDGAVIPLSGPLRIGAVLSLTGRYSRVGEQLRDGIELAIGARASSGTGPDVELVVVDDSSDVQRGAELALRLAEEGVIAVLGPIRSETLAAAAAGRSYAGLAILSPTASSDSGTGPNAASLWDLSRRAAGIGGALGRWLPSGLGVRRLAVLHPEVGGGRAGAEAFVRAAREAGAEIVGVRAYHPDSTTFAEPIAAIAEADPEAVLVLTDAARTVLQIAPQLVYYGLRSRLIAGGENWSEPDVLRRLDPSFSDHRLVATYMDRAREGSGWDRFREAYERRYERGLPDNLLTALGYDAAALALAAVPVDGLPRPGALSRKLREIGRIEGATGTFRIVPAGFDTVAGGGWALEREVLIRMVVDGALVEVDAAAIATWLEQARDLEERLRGGRGGEAEPGGGPAAVGRSPLTERR